MSTNRSRLVSEPYSEGKSEVIVVLALAAGMIFAYLYSVSFARFADAVVEDPGAR